MTLAEYWVSDTEALQSREDGITPEMKAAIENDSTAIHFHGLAGPSRIAWFHGDDKPVYDITGRGLPKGDEALWASYDEVIQRKSWDKLAQPTDDQQGEQYSAILPNRLVTGHFFGLARTQIKNSLQRHLWETAYKPALKDKIPFVDPFLHQILPLLPPEFQDLMVKIGKAAWEEDMGEKLDGKPFGFWPPELAINEETLDILGKNGVKFLRLDRRQINDDGRRAPLYRVQTRSGDTIIVFPFNRHLHTSLADFAYRKTDVFADEIEWQGMSEGISEGVAIDMETAGEHHPDQIWFYNHLLHVIIPGRESVGRIKYQGRTVEMIQDATIIESSWSCEHTAPGTKYPRWSGEYNHCKCHGENYELNMQKAYLYNRLRAHADRLVGELQDTDAKVGVAWQQEFISWFLRERVKLVLGGRIHMDGVSEERQQVFKQTTLALLGLQSCGFFHAGDFERAIPRNTLAYLDEMQELPEAA